MRWAKYWKKLQPATKIRAAMVRHSVNAMLGGDDYDKPIGQSFYRRQLEAASRYALENNIDPFAAVHLVANGT